MLAAACAFALAASPQPSAPALRLIWKAPQGNAHWVSQSSVNVTVTFQMSSVLKAMAGHRADPTYIVEDRTRTYAKGDATGSVNVDDAFTRRHGGPHPSDTEVKKRARKQTVSFDPSGRFGMGPFLCKGEPTLNDADPDPKTYHACPATETAGDHPYEDPGDAALAEFPAGPVTVGSSWSFTRPITAGRDFSSGTLTYVDTLQRVEERDGRQIAVIDVAATGRVDLPSDLVARGFHTGTMSLNGTAQFDVTRGVPDAAHYAAHALWHASILGANIGLAYDETYDATPWSVAPP
jgi:hypothetical protein